MTKLRFDIRNMKMRIASLERNWLDGKKPSIHGADAQVLKKHLEDVERKFFDLNLEVQLLQQKVKDSESS